MSGEGYTFLIIPDDVLEDPRVDWPAKIVWSIVWSFSRQRMDCWISLDELATRTHRSRRQVSDYISQLKTLGWLEVSGINGRRRHLTAVRPSTIATDRHHSDGPPPSRPAATMATDRASDTRPAARLHSDPPPSIKKEEKIKEKIKKHTHNEPTPKKDRPRDLEEVRAYFAEIGGSDPEQFYDYWTSAGWRRKSGPIRDWRATARTWTRSPYRRGPSQERQLDAGRGLEWANR